MCTCSSNIATNQHGYPHMIARWSLPVLRAHSWVPPIPTVFYRCSDGAEYIDAKVARRHQRLLNKGVNNCYIKLAETSLTPNAK